MTYLQQTEKDGPQCSLFAICNAARYLGVRSPEPGSTEWEAYLQDFGGIAGPIIDLEKAAERMGLIMTRILFSQIPDFLPAFVTVVNQEVGHYLHATLVVECSGPNWTLVNYRPLAGPSIESVRVVDIEFPIPPNDRYWNLAKKQGGASG